jgi:hypothetical protein
VVRPPLSAFALLAALSSAPLAAQLPAGWKIRSDANGTDSLSSLVRMPPGWHVGSKGPGAILYDPTFVATGRYALEWEVHVFPDTRDGEPFGLFIGGRELDGADITGFSIRFTKAGQMSVSRRTGRTAMTVLSPEQVPSFVVPKGDETGLNVIRVTVETDSVRILVNGVRAGAFAAGMDTDGIFGLRVGTGTNLHVTRLDKITPLAPASTPRPAPARN